MRLLASCLILLSVAAGGCVDDSDDSLDVVVVVQETNVPCTGECPSPCETRFDYELEVQTTCGAFIDVTVCSERVLCAAEIDEAVAGVRSCEHTDGSYRTSADADCGPG